MKTRFQIMALLSAAAVLEFLIRPLIGQRPRIVCLLLDATFIVVAAITVKIAIEGRPHYPDWMRAGAATLSVVF